MGENEGEYAFCDLCGRLFSIRLMRKITAKTPDEEVVMFICEKCWEREVSAAEKYIKKAKRK